MLKLYVMARWKSSAVNARNEPSPRHLSLEKFDRLNHLKDFFKAIEDNQPNHQYA
ncbi:MAG: hypothetical protein IKT98_08775 [Selenomonadaceae bacterium]|nr:hypothetical protein [Selenomonadaceae bacterium]